MNVMVIIKRVFRMDQTKQLVPLLKKLRTASEKQPGFISRTTYSKLNDPGELVVVMEWKTADDWIKWMNHKDAKELQWQVDTIIGEKTVFEVYQPEDF
ncbi:MAG: antibiotic biosynthesis monooxygenase [Desulfobacterales bacterium]|jgi:heme-degrading monooxygenase HmoA